MEEELEAARQKAVAYVEKSAGEKLAMLSPEDRKTILNEAVFHIVDANGGQSWVSRIGPDTIADRETGEVYTRAEWFDLLATRKQIAQEHDFQAMAEGYEMTAGEIFSLFMSP